ncbi:MAG TPA: hypothetical protein VJZ00_22665, partial [Thermoanaerobaculia bacterium]|nr:hypothetical protein [Thermoanaerobaculia bacterium]
MSSIRRRRWLAALVIPVVAIAVLWRRHPEPAPVTRFIEPRVSGAAWAPLARVERGGTNDLQMSAAISGIQRLLHEPATNDSAAVWNDRAAAYLVRDDLQNALVAADRALELQPGYPEALFNRALVLERYHFRDAAADAWREAVAAESNTEWGA